MLYYLFFFVLRPYFSPLNVFRYITVRTAVASLTALLLSLLLGPWVIDRLRDLQVKQYIREEGPKAASEKGRHADDGRRADRCRDRDSHFAVGRSAQSVRVAGGGRDAGVRDDRIHRRLQQSGEAAEHGAYGRAQNFCFRC